MLTSLFYELAARPAEQTKLRDALLSLAEPDGTLSFAALEQCGQLTGCINETFRCVPKHKPSHGHQALIASAVFTIQYQPARFAWCRPKASPLATCTFPEELKYWRRHVSCISVCARDPPCLLTRLLALPHPIPLFLATHRLLSTQSPPAPQGSEVIQTPTFPQTSATSPAQPNSSRSAGRIALNSFPAATSSSPSAPVSPQPPLPSSQPHPHAPSSLIPTLPKQRRPQLHRQEARPARDARRGGRAAHPLRRRSRARRGRATPAARVDGSDRDALGAL